MKPILFSPITLILVYLCSFTIPCFGEDNSIKFFGKSVMPENNRTHLFTVNLLSDNLVTGTDIIMEEADGFIELLGNVLIPENSETRFYRLELLSDNVVLETGIVVDGESFLLRVKKNSLYTIRITKEGYYSLVVSVSTHISEHNNTQYNFDNTYFKDLHGFSFFMSLQASPYSPILH